MLVFFQFRRYGYYAKGLVESDNLDKAVKALWSEPITTFRWEDMTNYLPDNINTLTVEEWNEQSGTKVEPEAKPGR